MKTQNAMVLEHLQERGPITPLEALREYGCFRLGARIYQLKKDGHRIETERLDVGQGRFVAKYSLAS